MVVYVLQDNGTALHFASWCGHPTVVQTLLDAGVDVGAQDNVSASGYTCTHMYTMYVGNISYSLIHSYIYGSSESSNHDNNLVYYVFF